MKSALRKSLSLLAFGAMVMANALPASAATQGAYRWRNDDGSETAATWAAAENTAISNFTVGESKRLRFGVAGDSGETELALDSSIESVSAEKLQATCIDPTNTYLYTAETVTSGTPHVIRVRLSDFTVQGTLALPAGMKTTLACAFDESGTNAYFGNSDASGFVAKVRLSDFTVLDTLATLTGGVRNLFVRGGYLYAMEFVTGSPSRLERINLSSFASDGSLSFAGVDNGYFYGSALSPEGIAYFGSYGAATVFPNHVGVVARVNVDTMAFVGSPLALTTGSSYLVGSGDHLHYLVDGGDGNVYVNARNLPASRLIRVNKTSFTQTGALDMTGTASIAALKSDSLGHVYARSSTVPNSNFTRVDLASFTSDASPLTLSSTNGAPFALDVSRGYAYAVGYDAPSRIRRISIAPHRDLRLEAAPKAGTCAATATGWQAVTAGSSPFKLTTSTYLADQALTENVAAMPANGADADGVLGQADFTHNAINRGGSAAANTSRWPIAMLVDPVGRRLFESDYGNNRVLVFNLNADGTPIDDVADYVLGQANFSVTSANRGGAVAANTLSAPSGLAMDFGSNRLFVADSGNNRVLAYDLTAGITNGMAAIRVLGQTLTTTNGSSTTASTMNWPYSVVWDAKNSRLFVSEMMNNRVLSFDLGAGITDGMAASHVLGQADFTHGDANRGGAVTANSINGAYDLEWDATNARLFVSDSNNSRVLAYSLASGITDGMAASHVLGQADFTHGTENRGGAVAANTLQYPSGIVWDQPSSRLIVSDWFNHRVLAYEAVNGIVNGMNASHVLGQADFTHGDANRGGTVAANTMQGAGGLTWDAVHKRLFMADFTNNRALYFSLDAVTDTVAGMPNPFVQGRVVTTSASTGTIGLSGGAFTEAEFVVTPTAAVTNSASYCFRVTDAGTPLATYSSVAEAQVAGSNVATLSNSVTLGRLAAGSTDVPVAAKFTLSSVASTPLTVTFPSGFTVTKAFTSGTCSGGGTIGSFTFTSTTLVAAKSSCTGTVTLSGATVSLPSAAGAYTINWVNDDPGSATVIVVSNDQVNVAATVDPSIAFDVGAASSCDGAFTSSDWSVDLGRMSTGRTVASSGDASGAQLICTRLSTNATYGAVVTVHNANGPSGLVSASTPADRIPSAAAAVTSGTPNYGLCYSTVPGDSGYDAGLTPASTSPDASAGLLDVAACTSSVASGAESVAVLTVAPQEAWRVAGVASNAFAAMRVKAAISATQPAHNDYSDSLTFVATATF